MSKAEGAAGKGAKGAPRTKTHMCIRRIPIAYTVGQLCPKIEVPAPKSKKAQSYVSKRLHVFICNTFKSEKLKYEQKFNAGGSVPKYWGLTKDKCTAAFGAPPQPLEARMQEFTAPVGLPEILLKSLDAKLASATGLARAAYLVGVSYEHGNNSEHIAQIGNK